MARKHVVYAFDMFDAVSLGASATSSIVEVSQLDYASIYVSWTGSSTVGDLEVQAANGEDGTYHALDFGSTISISGASGSHNIILSEMPFTHIKLVYTRSSGTGSITATLTAKSASA